MNVSAVLLLLAMLAAAASVPGAGARSTDISTSAPELDEASRAGNAADGSMRLAQVPVLNASASVEVDPGLGEPAEVEFRTASRNVARPPGSRNAPFAEASPEVASAALATATALAIGLAIVAYLNGGVLAGIGGPLFSRIVSSKILDNDVRNRIHECIIMTPGVTIKEITRLVGIGWGTSVYHLRRLEQGRLIVSERNRQFRRYYKNGGGIGKEAKAGLAELKNPTAERLAAAIAHRPGTGQKELCASVGISASIAHKHLGRLEGAQLLTTQREWKSVRYFPTHQLVALLAPSHAQAIEGVTVAAV